MRSDDDLGRDTDRLLGLMREMGRRNTLRDPLSSAAEALEFSPPQIHALLWLGSDGPLTMSVLAERVSVTEKTITGLVDRLENAGLVKRERDEKDRRVVHALLTERGRASAGQIEAGLRQNTRAFLSLLSTTDCHALLRIIGTVAARMAELSTKAEKP